MDNVNHVTEEAVIRENARLVRKCIRPYFLRGGDQDDLYQEGMIGLLSALRSYDAGRNDNFQAYAALCIKRRIIDAVRRDDAQMRCFGEPSEMPEGKERPEGGRLSDPELSIVADESAREIKEMLSGVASPFERAVLDGFLEGYTTSEIAERLGRERKAVDNAIRRARVKLADYLSKRR